MAERAAVQCEVCGHPYSARFVGEEAVLPTDDGKCVCGGDAFVKVSDATVL